MSERRTVMDAANEAFQLGYKQGQKETLAELEVILTMARKYIDWMTISKHEGQFLRTGWIPAKWVEADRTILDKKELKP